MFRGRKKGEETEVRVRLGGRKPGTITRKGDKRGQSSADR